MRYRLMLVILGPFVMWSIYFITLYGIQAVGCRANWDTVFLAGIPVLRLILVTLLVLSAVASTSIYIVTTKVHADQVMRRIGSYCAAAGLFSTILIFPGVFWLQLC